MQVWVALIVISDIIRILFVNLAPQYAPIVIILGLADVVT